MTTTTPTRRHHPGARTWALAVTATTAALVLTGCTSAPTPAATTATVTTPTPTTTPTLSPEQVAQVLQDKNVTDAQATYVAYTATWSQIQLESMANWERIYPFISSDLVESVPQYFMDNAAAGVRGTGDYVVASQSLVEYLVDPTGAGDRLTLDVCLDTSAVDLVRPDGTSTLVGDIPKRLITRAVMQQQDDKRWTVDSEVTTSQPC